MAWLSHVESYFSQIPDTFGDFKFTNTGFLRATEPTFVPRFSGDVTDLINPRTWLYWICLKDLLKELKIEIRRKAKKLTREKKHLSCSGPNGEI